MALKIIPHKLQNYGGNEFIWERACIGTGFRAHVIFESASEKFHPGIQSNLDTNACENASKLSSELLWVRGIKYS